MATTQETLATVQGIKNQVTQIGVETQASLDKIIELEKLRDQAGETNQEVTAALEELKTMVTAVNDKIPDITQPA